MDPTSSRSTCRLGFAWLLMALLAACTPDALPTPDPRAASGGSAPAVGTSKGGLALAVDPPSSLEAVPLVARFTLSHPSAAIDPSGVVLVRGTVGSRSLHELSTGMPSDGLTARLVPALAFLAPGAPPNEGQGGAGAGPEGSVVVAPEQPLEAGKTYTIASLEPAGTVSFQVMTGDTVRLLPRIWPPPGLAAGASSGVWCGAATLPAFELASSLQPDGLAGVLARGALEGDLGRACLRFSATSPGGKGPAVAPPAVTLPGGRVVRLDPRPFVVEAPVTPIEALPCEPGEARFGPGCVTVDDDRLHGRSPGSPVLWGVAGEGVNVAFATSPGDPFVVAGLPPSTRIQLAATTSDTAGRTVASVFTTTTRPPRAHVVINEALAYPLGPNAEEKWVELYNDGHEPAYLTGFVLAVAGNGTPLPDAVLRPGAFALVVREGYVAHDGVDQAPPADTLLLAVPQLGKRGLSHEGEALALLDGSAQVVSLFPATPKPKQGLSVARVTPAAPDGLAASFARQTPTPGRPNRP